MRWILAIFLAIFFLGVVFWRVTEPFAHLVAAESRSSIHDSDALSKNETTKDVSEDGGKWLSSRASQILWPPKNAVILKGTFPMIATGQSSEIHVDGKRLERESRWHEPLQLTWLGLNPGVHELTIGSTTQKFCVALNDVENEAPRNWPICRSHTIRNLDNGCEECHASTTAKVATDTTESSRWLEAPEIPEKCVECHTTEAFETTHQHPADSLTDCTLCHRMHSSRREKLLLYPKDILCTQCHEAREASDSND